MKDANAILSTAKETILLESNAIANLANLLDSSFIDAVNFIFNSKGRVIVTGIGKSANIANKMNWELARIKKPKNKIKVKILLKINKLILIF